MNADPITYEDLKHLPPEATRARAERYYKVAIQTRKNLGESSRKAVRASPLPGQGFPPVLNVSCGKDIRYNNPIGTVFIVWAKLSFDERHDAYDLFTDPRWEAEKISEEEAKVLVEQKRSGLQTIIPSQQSSGPKNENSWYLSY